MTLSIQAQQYNFIKYSISDGLPQSQVYAVHQDNKGYIWLGTQGGGVSRFDGNKFENFSTKHGLPSNYIQAIYEDSQHRIWIGTKRGLCYYNGQEFVRIKRGNKNINTAWAFHQYNDSTLWVGTRKGLLAYSLTQDTILPADVAPALMKSPINGFYKDKKQIWIASDKGGWVIGKETKQFTNNTTLSGNQIQAITTDSTGSIWLIAFDGGITQVDRDSLYIKAQIKPAQLNRVQCAYTAPDGKIWIGTQNRGISVYQPEDSSWTRISERQGLAHNHVRSIVEDDWNNLWIGTSGGGVTKYLGQFFVHFNKNNGLHGNRIYALCKDHENKLWISASNNGLATYDGIQFQKSERDSGYIDVKSKVIFQDSKRRLWAGTERKGLVMMDTLDSLGYRLFTLEDGLPGNHVNSIAEDAQGNIWIGTQTQGIVRLSQQDTTWNIQVWGKQQGLYDTFITTLKADKKGNIWFATRSGRVGYFVNNQLANIYDQNDGLPLVAIRSIAFDTLGHVWFGTAGDGILMLNPEADSATVEPIKSEEELTSDNIYLLIFDKQGNLWAGSETGVDKIILNEAGVVLEVQHYGRNEGFLGIETCTNSAICDESGNLWFGTMNGLTKHIPSQKSREELPPVIHFKDISLFYKSLTQSDFADWVLPTGGLKNGLELPYNQNHLSFDFKAVNLSDPESIRYRWQLKGAENEWSPLSQRESVNYSQLPPGEYEFIVQAVSDETLSSEPVLAAFTIKKPFWQKRWVQLLAGFVLLLWAYSIYRSRIRKIRKKEAVKREKLEIENRVLQLEQKALQLQMNPHFIFNALNSIQSLVATKDYASARTEINNFATLMRGILSNSRKEKITLQEEINTLQKYLQVEQFCQAVPFEYHIQALENVDIEEVELPPMLLQPFVENAIIHGISHLQNKTGQLDIVFSIVPRQGQQLLQCQIRDNGVGRKKAAQLRQSNAPGHQSVAMEVTRERLEAMKAEAKYTTLEIADIPTSDGAIGGTEVIVKMPLFVNF